MQTSSRVLPAQVALYKDSSVVSRNTSHCTTLWQAPYAFTPRKFAGSRLRKATLTLQIQTPTQVSKKNSSQSQLAKNEWSEHQCVMIDASLASTTAIGQRICRKVPQVPETGKTRQRRPHVEASGMGATPDQVKAHGGRPLRSLSVSQMLQQSRGHRRL